MNGGSVASYYLSNSFRQTGKYGESRPGHMHAGTDFAAKQGTPIRALLSGTVVRKAYQKGGAGNYVVIRHADGSETKYFHMKSQSPLKVGTKVSAGQVIGGVGSTGRSSGPHLHLEYWKNGKSQNPLPILQSLSKMKAPTSSARKTTAGSSFIRGTALRQVPSSIKSYVSKASSTYKVRPELIAAIMKQESAFRTNARSGAGAYGLMQLMPHFGSARLNPQSNVLAGTQYIAQQLKKFGDVRIALAAYNAGPGRVGGLVKKYGNNWAKINANLPKETRNYVTKVLGYL